MGPRVILSLELGHTYLALFKQNSKNAFHVMRFLTGALFSFDFSLNFLRSLLVTHYVACLYLCAWRVQES